MQFLILGAGPAGLTVGNRLHQLGMDDFIILEKELSAGGLCRSVDVDGTPFDIGGGHFLDVRRPDVNNFLFDFMPQNEWNIFDRNSQISFKNKYIGHPFEANIWQLDIDDQVEFIKSIAKAGCNNIESRKPVEFIDWIYWKLGDRIAEDYMIPYNKKIFCEDLNFLGTYWLEKLPDVSLDETIRSCLDRKPYGTEPGHSQFYYPKKCGYGELWNRMALKIKKNIIFGESVEGLDFDNHMVETDSGEKYHANMIISTIPWTSIKKYTGLPTNLLLKIKKLKYSSVETRYFRNNLNTNAHWIYYPDKDIPFHRILIRKNFSIGAKGYWTETNAKRLGLFEKNDNLFTYLALQG